ncbi:IS256 family transposase [Streptomyces sp. NPDC005476]|uniref:IS256 family transposase n=1 Tax=Streptomyces sp. NPDC005476 TaxID=3156882 RepID=UPI003451AC7D
MPDLISRALTRRTVRTTKPSRERTWKHLSPLLRLLILTQLTFNIGFFAVLPFLAEHLGTALGMAGWMVGFVLGLRTFSQQGLFVVGGALVDRYGVRPIVLTGCVLRVAGFAWPGYAQTTWTVIGAVLLIGFAAALFSPAVFLGSSAGLSPATVTRLTKQWSDDHAAFQDRDLSESDYVYVWADGVHPKVRLGQARSCVLVLMGVRTDGRKELIALAEGLRESTESWADLLRDCRRRGMRDPELVVADGAMGLWRALAEVFPQARNQRCWVHKTRNVVNALPKSAQPGAKKALQEIYNAEDRDHAQKAVKEFERIYGAKWPKAVKKVSDETDELLAFYDFPAEHWVHLRTTNPIESTFSTVKLRTRVTRGAGSPAAALAMVFKLAESAQARWRAITAPHLVALVRNGATFQNGYLVERPEVSAA